MTASQKSQLAVVGAALIVLLALTQRPALQLTAALATCLVLPGLGWSRKLRSGDRGDTFALTLVISICATVLIATGMAVSGWWSPAGGLAALAAVTLLGFVPYRQLVARAGAVLPAPVPVAGQRVAWTDWYADARRRSAEQREADRLAAAESSAQWRDWYATREREGDPAAVPPNWWLDRQGEAIPEVVFESAVREPELVPATPVRAPVVEIDDDDDISGVGASWNDWYAAARQRDDAARRRTENDDRSSGVEWRDWYRRASKDAGH